MIQMLNSQETVKFPCKLPFNATCYGNDKIKNWLQQSNKKGKDSEKLTVANILEENLLLLMKDALE